MGSTKTLFEAQAKRQSGWKRQLGGSTLSPSGGETYEIALGRWRSTLVELGVDAFSVRWVLKRKRQLGGPDPIFSLPM